MYPEFGETDFIEAFKETETLTDHIQVVMFIELCYYLSIQLCSFYKSIIYLFICC